MSVNLKEILLSISKAEFQNVDNKLLNLTGKLDETDR